MKTIRLDPDSIKIPESRFRKDFSKADLERLKRSIAEVGQLQPIGVVLDDEGHYVLVYGHRRLLAMRELKKEIGDSVKIQAILLGEAISDLNLQIIEFVENAVRADFTPAEKAIAVHTIHERLKSENPGWTVGKTAETIGLSRTYVQEQLGIAKAILSGGLDKDEAKKLTMKELRKAVNSVERAKALQKAVIAKEVIKRSQNLEAHYSIINADCFSWSSEERFEICLTDPPYGMDYKEQSKTADRASDFDDDPLKYMSPDFIDKFWKLLDRLLHPELGIAIVSCSLEQFLLHRQFAPQNGFSAFYRRPLVWIKTGAGIPYQAKYFPTSGYEILFFAKRTKETPIFKYGTPDWINYTQVEGDRIHPTQKPIGLYEILLERYAFPDYKLIDPFCGSGSSIIAAAKKLLPKAVGLELNPETATLAQQRLSKVLSDLESDLFTK